MLPIAACTWQCSVTAACCVLLQARSFAQCAHRSEVAVQMKFFCLLLWMCETVSQGSLPCGRLGFFVL